jgi:hypothetical protein
MRDAFSLSLLPYQLTFFSFICTYRLFNLVCRTLATHVTNPAKPELVFAPPKTFFDSNLHVEQERIVGASAETFAFSTESLSAFVAQCVGCGVAVTLLADDGKPLVKAGAVVLVENEKCEEAVGGVQLVNRRATLFLLTESQVIVEIPFAKIQSLQFQDKSMQVSSSARYVD